MTPKEAETPADQEPPKLTPYQGKSKCFGFFRCSKCNRQWSSGHSWANTSQACRACKTRVFPSHQRPLLRRKKLKPSGDDPSKAHDIDLCGKCQELGFSCVSFGRDDRAGEAPRNGERSKKSKKKKKSKRRGVENEAL